MKLLTSTDYDQFEMLGFNRDVIKTRKLEISMKQHGWIPAYPAHVIKEEGKLKIKAGHHRFCVAEKLGIPVVYVICNDNSSIHELETSTVKWSIQDYLTSYVRLGDPDYEAVQRFQQRTGISLSACISMLAGECASSNNKMNAFKAGEYTVKDTQNAEIVADIITAMKSYGIKWATETLVVQSLSRIITAGHADIARLKHKLKANATLAQKQPNQQAYTEMFENIYNHAAKASQKIPLAFLTNEALRQRQSNFGKLP
jgi:hypothetical protein